MIALVVTSLVFRYYGFAFERFGLGVEFGFAFDGFAHFLLFRGFDLGGLFGWVIGFRFGF